MSEPAEAEDFFLARGREHRAVGRDLKLLLVRPAAAELVVEHHYSVLEAVYPVRLSREERAREFKAVEPDLRLGRKLRSGGEAFLELVLSRRHVEHLAAQPFFVAREPRV